MPAGDIRLLSAGLGNRVNVFGQLEQLPDMVDSFLLRMHAQPDAAEAESGSGQQEVLRRRACDPCPVSPRYVP